MRAPVLPHFMVLSPLKIGELLEGTDHSLPGTGWAPLTQEADTERAELWKLRPGTTVSRNTGPQTLQRLTGTKLH